MTRSHANPEVAARSPGNALNQSLRSAGQTGRAQPIRSTQTPRPKTARPISAMTVARLQAAVTALAPAVIAGGLLYHPDIGTPSDADFLARLAAAVVADPERWAVSHLAVGVGSGLMILAFLSIRSHLRAAGEDRWSVLALPFVTMGSVLFALLPGMEFAPLAAAEAGVDIQAIQAALLPRFRPILQLGAVVFAIGAIGFAVGIAKSGLLGPALTWIVVGAFILMAVARFSPLLATQLYIGSAAGILALWPVAYAMWRQVAARRAPEV